MPDLYVSGLQTGRLSFEEAHDLSVKAMQQEWRELREGEELPSRLHLTFMDLNIPDVYVTDWAIDAHTKVGTFRTLRLLEPHLQRALVVCEAWYVVARTREELAAMEGVRASEHPYRKECVKVSTYERDGRQLTTTFEILPDRTLGEPELSDVQAVGELTFFTDRPN